jgi:hypothetical protein
MSEPTLACGVGCSHCEKFWARVRTFQVVWLQAIAEQQRTLASSPQVSQMDWFASMLKAQADFTQQSAKMVGGMGPLGQQPQS